MSKQLEGILNRAPRAIVRTPTPSTPAPTVSATVTSLPTPSAAPNTEAEAPETVREREVSLGIEVPESVKRAIAIKAATDGVTNRTLLLQALQAAGIAVAEQELRDRRK